MNAKRIGIMIVGFIVLFFVIQFIAYSNCKANVKKALLDPKLQDQYKKCTTDGFHKNALEGSDYTTSATVKVFPFGIQFTKWNTSDEIYWDNAK